MASTKNSKVGHVVLSVLISSTFLLANVLEDQNLCALTSGDRYTTGFSHGEQQAGIDFENNSPFPVCVSHTTYYCAGYVKGYNVTWNNLAANDRTSNANPPTSNSSSPLPPASNANTTAANPHTIVSSVSDCSRGNRNSNRSGNTISAGFICKL